LTSKIDLKLYPEPTKPRKRAKEIEAKPKNRDQPKG
jgi:hypothetical protein